MPLFKFRKKNRRLVWSVFYMLNLRTLWNLKHVTT
jgi:hypothetical protein